MMQETDISYQDKLDELQLDISHPLSLNRAFIFVEGESDVRFFQKLFDIAVCKIEKIPGGNRKVEMCTAHFATQHPAIIGIRDADFLHLHHELYAKSYMFLTDYHDMEMCLVAEDEVFCSVLREYLPVADATYASEQQILALRASIIHFLADLSLLKYLNFKHDWGLAFSPVFFGLKLACDSGLDFDAYLLRVLNSHNAINHCAPDVEKIKAEIEITRQQNLAPLQLCNGHDFIHALALYIKNAHWHKNLTDEDLVRNFRLVYRQEHWRNTELFTATSAWAAAKQRRIYPTLTA